MPDNQFANNVLGNYGRILAEYPYLKDFRKNKMEKFIKIDGLENLNKIKNKKKPVVFISGHFNNFELMAMQIEKQGINLAAIYKPIAVLPYPHGISNKPPPPHVFFVASIYAFTIGS